MGSSDAPTALPIDSISAYLLDLHRASQELSLRAFQERSFARLASVLDFDSGLLGVGTFQGAVPAAHDAYLHAQPPELMASWEPLKQFDVVAAAAMSQPGRTQRFVADEVFAEHPALLAHCRTFGLEHVLCTASIAERAGHYVVFSIYRRDPQRPFTETDRKSVELIVPHVVEAVRQAKLAQLRRTTRSGRPENQSAAIVNRAGVVLEAEPDFIELLAEAHPRWSGPWLPPPLASLAEVRSHERRTIGRLVLRVDPGDDLLLVHARRATIVDSLTEREHEVARLFASGESAKQIAQTLGIAPNTVRVHIGRIYEKLGVVNKAELASMLAGHD